MLLKHSELLELNQNATAIRMLSFSWLKAYPVNFPFNSKAPRFMADASDADNSVKVEFANSTHAIVDSKAAITIRIAFMCPLVSEDAHIGWFVPPN